MRSDGTVRRFGGRGGVSLLREEVWRRLRRDGELVGGEGDTIVVVRVVGGSVVGGSDGSEGCYGPRWEYGIETVDGICAD